MYIGIIRINNNNNLLIIINSQALSCSIRLPQDEPPPCKLLRRNDLKTSRATYGLRRATPEMPYNRLDMSTPQYYGFVRTNQFLASHARMYIGHYRFGEAVSNAYIKSPFYGRPEMTMKDFAVIMNFYKKTISSQRNPFRVCTCNVAFEQTALLKQLLFHIHKNVNQNNSF